MKGEIYSGMVYRGWFILRSKNAPVTGRWRATRHGVGMGHNDAAGLRSMIDVRESEQRDRYRDRSITDV